MSSSTFNYIGNPLRLVLPRLILIAGMIVSVVCSLTVAANTDTTENTAPLQRIEGERNDVEWSDAAVSHHVDADNYKGKLEHEQLKELAQAGKALFSARFTVADGVGTVSYTHLTLPTTPYV